MSYRNDDDALRTRHDLLVRQLADLDARLGVLGELSEERVRVARELAGLRADLDTEARRRAPVRLAKLEVASPCRERWDGMVGDDRVRHCARCDKDVFNLSDMTTGEAEALLGQHGTSICVRFYRRADGTVKTRDCGSSRALVAGAIAAGAFAAAGAVAAAFTRPAPIAAAPITTEVIEAKVVEPPPPPEPLAEEMGGMSAPRPDVEILGGL